MTYKIAILKRIDWMYEYWMYVYKLRTILWEFHQSTTAKIVVGNKEAASARILIGMQELHNLIPDSRTPKVAFFRAWWYKLRSYIATLMYFELNHYKWYR